MLQSQSIIPHSATSVDFRTIDSCARSVTNRKKHVAEPVSKDAYISVEPEIRKFIKAFVQPDADLTFADQTGGFSSPSAMEFLRKIRFFDPDDGWDYVLIIDSVRDLPKEQKESIALLPWNMIMEFGADADTCGLSHAYFTGHNGQKQTLKFRPENPEQTCFDKYPSSPYWYYLDGISDLPQTLNGGDLRSWRQKNRSMGDAIKRYHQIFDRRIRIVLFSKELERVKHILEKFDDIYEDSKEVFFTRSRYKELSESESFRGSDVIELEIDDFARSIISNPSIINKVTSPIDCFMPGKDGTPIPVRADRYSHFELVHKNIAANADPKIEENTSKYFYRGLGPLSWYGAREEFAVSRTAVAKKLRSTISEFEGMQKLIHVIHDAGAGGSTFSRNFAFQIRNENPVCILRQYNKDVTAQQLSSLYNSLKSQVVVIADSGVISRDQIQNLYYEVKAYAVPAVIIYLRRKDKNTADQIYISTMSDYECNEMIQKLSPYCMTEEVRKKLNMIINATGSMDRTPFFMSLCVFQENFAGIRPYIKTFLDSMIEEQRNALTYLSIADLYANRPVNAAFFSSMFSSGEQSREPDEENSEYSRFDELVVFSQKDNTYKIRHPLFSKEIIRQVVYQDKNGDRKSVV